MDAAVAELADWVADVDAAVARSVAVLAKVNAVSPESEALLAYVDASETLVPILITELADSLAKVDAASA